MISGIGDCPELAILFARQQLFTERNTTAKQHSRKLTMNSSLKNRPVTFSQAMKFVLMEVVILGLTLAVANSFAGENQAAANAVRAGQLDHQFLSPPASAKPWVYWYFMDGNLTREGMLADLAAMKKAGIGGAIFLEVNIGIPRGSVDFMSPQWQQLFSDAMHEADRLGIQIALGSGPGWCGTGGPWITPDLAMQHLVASETNVTGPLKFSAALPRPRPRKPYFGESTLTPALKKSWQEFYRDVAVLAFPTPSGTNRLADINEKALYLRDPFSSRPGVKPFLPAPAEFPLLPAAACVDPARLIVLTPKMSADGNLVWDVPPGQWTIQRLGCTLTGQTTRPSPQPGLGFESDKFDRAAIDAHFAAFTEKLMAQVGSPTNADGGLTAVHFDSWEMGAQNWSPNFRKEFRKRRGYDPLKFLPAFSGRVVASEEISERFLWDVRQTAQELVFQNHLSRLAELAHEHGLTLSVEPYDLNPCGDLSLGRVADVPQCEFWYLGFNTFYSAFEAASIAHTCGRPVVAGEAFTSEPGENWQADPAALKPLGDWAFCTGVNRFDFHRFQAQPWTNRWPGMTMADYGVHWDRTQTWWDMAPAYHDYLSRCQFLLRRGVTVADVCFLAAEGAPHVFRPPGSATTGNPPDHGGYNFDGCAPETLLERATVKSGKIVFPGGTAYQILVLPERQTMTPRLLRKIKSLVAAGATVFGPPPVKSPSLENYPQCDAEVKTLAREIWGDCDGKSTFAHTLGLGQILWRETPVKLGEQYGDFAAVTNVLASQNLPPDFSSDGPVRFTHRCDGDTDIYFVANREAKVVSANCVFRVTAKQPELFDPLTGETRPLPQFKQRDGGTEISLHFDPGQSYFIVFRHPVDLVKTGTQNFPAMQSVLNLDGAWEVSFDPRGGGPERITFDALTDWSQRPEVGIKFYSGTAVYRKTFEVPSPGPLSGQNYFLELGDVKNLARIKLNGRDLGVVWCAPWRVAAGDALKAGSNQLEIEVANLWPNRLIGDLSLPVEKRYAWTTRNPFRKTSPLLPSGLFGPVSLEVTSP